jgi:hypothetical protein
MIYVYHMSSVRRKFLTYGRKGHYSRKLYTEMGYIAVPPFLWPLDTVFIDFVLYDAEVDLSIV